MLNYGGKEAAEHPAVTDCFSEKAQMVGNTKDLIDANEGHTINRSDNNDDDEIGMCT